MDTVGAGTAGRGSLLGVESLDVRENDSVEVE